MIGPVHLHSGLFNMYTFSLKLPTFPSFPSIYHSFLPANNTITTVVLVHPGSTLCPPCVHPVSTHVHPVSTLCPPCVLPVYTLCPPMYTLCALYVHPVSTLCAPCVLPVSTLCPPCVHPVCSCVVLKELIAFLTLQDKLVGEADSVTMVTHVQKSLSDWLKWHKTTDRSPASEIQVDQRLNSMSMYVST